MAVKPAPVPDSYWVAGRFVAGAYPGSPDEGDARARLRRAFGAGVTLFVDLTEQSEPLPPYAALLDEGVAAAPFGRAL